MFGGSEGQMWKLQALDTFFLVQGETCYVVYICSDETSYESVNPGQFWPDSLMKVLVLLHHLPQP